MKSLYNFVVKPKGERYNNRKKVGDKELILNTEVFNHQYINRVAVIVSTPKMIQTDLQPGDEIILHHNVFRRFHDVRGEEVNSKSYFDEDKYFVFPEQVFMYKMK